MITIRCKGRAGSAVFRNSALLSKPQVNKICCCKPRSPLSSNVDEALRADKKEVFMEPAYARHTVIVSKNIKRGTPIENI